MKNILQIVCAPILLFGLWLTIEMGADMNGVVLPWHKSNAIETTLAWGGLAPLPNDAQNINVKTEGGAFSRAFKLEFSISEKNFINWLNASSSLSGITALDLKSNKVELKISPGAEGSIGGWVKYSKSEKIVQVYMAWS